MNLALELRTSRMVRAMNQHVAVQTGTRVRLRARTLIRYRVDSIDGRHSAIWQVGTTVNPRTVVTGMAFLTQERHPCLQQRRIG